ncbi:hypothetical protein D3C81_1315300 [compost metagenome]
MAAHAAGLVPVAGGVHAAGQPEQALGAQHVAVFAQPFGMDQVGKALRMERAAPPVHQRRHAAVRLRRRALQGSQPAGSIRGGGEVEAAGAGHALRRHAAETGLDDLGAGVQRTQHRAQPRQLAGTGQVGLVQHDDVAELDLRGQHFRDGAVVFRPLRQAAVGQEIGLVEVGEEGGRVDHCHQRVGLQRGIGAGAVLGLEQEALGDGERVVPAIGLDQQRIEAPLRGQPRGVGHQRAGIRQHGGLAAGRQRRQRLAVLRAADQHGHAPAGGLRKQVVQQRGLAGAGKAGQHGDGQAISHGSRAEKVTNRRRRQARTRLLQQSCEFTRKPRPATAGRFSPW